MASAEELRNIIQRPVEEAFAGLSGKDAAMAALGIFSADEFKSEKAVGDEMKKLARQYVALLKTLTGEKKGWDVQASATNLGLDNEDAGIVIDINWKGNAITKKIDVVVDIARREGPERPGAKWRNKIHMVRDIVPTKSNLSPKNIIMDPAVRRFLKEQAEAILGALFEDEGWELCEAVEVIDKPAGQPKYKARMIIHPMDQKEYGGGQGLKRINLGNNSELIARVRVKGHPFSGAKFYSSGSMAMTMADAGHDVWLVGREGGKNVYVSIRPKGVKSDRAARRASYSTYGEPWNLEVWAKKHGFKLTPESYPKESDDMGPGELRSIVERKGTPYGKSHGSKEADLWGSKHGEKKYVGSKHRSGHSKQAKKTARKGERQAAKKEIQARMHGEANHVADLRSVIEGKPKGPVKGGGQGYWSRKEKKGELKKKERRSKAKEIRQQMRGESDVSLDDLGLVLEALSEELQEAMVDAETAPVKPIEPVQMRNLKTIHETAAQLGRFTTEFAKWLAGAMRAKQVDVERLGRFGRQVDAAHRIFKDTYRKLALGYREEYGFDDESDALEEEFDSIEEAMAIGATGAFEVPSPVPFAKKATLAGRRHWRKQLRRHGIPMGAQEMMMELAQIAPSLPPADRKLVNKVMDMTWYGPEDLGNTERNAYVDAIKKLHKRIFGKIRNNPTR